MFVLFNATDGVPADPRTFKTRAAAEKAKADFPKRFAIQGYYLTADGRRIDPKDVALEVQPA